MDIYIYIIIYIYENRLATVPSFEVTLILLTGTLPPKTILRSWTRHLFLDGFQRVMFGVEPRVVISGCAARAEATVALYAPKAGGSGAFGTSGHGEIMAWWNSGWDLEELEAFEEQKEGACDHDSPNMEITSKGTAAKSFKGFWSCSYVAVYTHNIYTCTQKKRRTQSEVQQLLMML